MSRTDLSDLRLFAAIARFRSFRRAADEMSVSTSALSHAISKLERRLEVRLLHRTTRSVTPTEAGMLLLEGLTSGFSQIDGALDQLNRFRDQPIGRIRLTALRLSLGMLLDQLFPVLAERYPGIELEVSADDRMVDLVAEGFDAGIRFGDTVPQDMVTVRLSPDLRWVIVGAPSYFARHGRPREPGDLAGHQGIRGRSGNGRLYEWELGAACDVHVSAPAVLCVSDPDASMRAAVAGVGLAYLPEEMVRPQLADGRLEIVMPEWASPGAGFHLYYPSRRQLPAGVRILIDLLREIRPLG
ncbi:LysR family transcriptional regulator [Rhodovarius crocodyli]|uniref:LysR family transcriptional regulator n=1 Tax=Rhodovarius crocodyli TaxID=1979269 RepID=A0A437MJ93_9PROT|nr:LysR family transcriptional regulator [Rhodovarius crocodyli]RVT97712.1 LysR family transcriptional regulator [Rhodovarius crocodyli]